MLLQSRVFLSAYWCRSNDINSEDRERLRQIFSYLSGWNVSRFPPSFTDPASISVFFPSPCLPSPPLSLCIFSLFFSSWTAYCSILKVPACVLSCPLLPSMHCSDLELCRLRMGAHFWCRERGGWRTGRHDDAALYTLSMVSLSAHCCHQFEKGFFFSLPFLLFFILALKSCPWSWKKRKKLSLLQTESASRRIVLMWPTLAHTGESSNCQTEREVCVCLSVCLHVCVLCKTVTLLGQEMHEFRYFTLSAASQFYILFSTLCIFTILTCACPNTPYSNTQTHTHAQREFALWL